MSRPREAIDRAYELARRIGVELRSGLTRGAGAIGLVTAYVLWVLVLLMPFAIAVVVVVEVLS